jgi:hypothetical protein
LAFASGGYFHLELGEACDIVAGDTVRLSDGTTDRTHIVRNLAITATDAEADTVAGTADESAVVYVWQHEPGEQVAATADPSGDWLADLTGFYEIVPGSDGRSEIRDEAGNGTAVDWHAPNPRFTVFPEWEWIEANEWTDGVAVTVTVAGRPECETEAYPSDGYFGVGFPEDCDVVDGDVVALTDGSTSKQLTVTNLAVTWFDLAEGFVGGTGSPELEVHIWVHEVNSSFMITSPDEYGDWGVDFDDVGFTIVPGTAGLAEQVDEDSDATAVAWSIPNPTVTVFLEWEGLTGLAIGTGSTFDRGPGYDGVARLLGRICHSSGGLESRGGVPVDQPRRGL